MLMLPRHRQQSGDTIVEVMIALAILGLAIGLSYATANRSLLAARQAQESSMATELLEAQVEALRTMAPSSKPTDPGSVYQPGTFCIASNTRVDSSNPTFSSKCKSQKGLYDITDTYSPPGPVSPADPNPDTFEIKATWDDVAGDGTDSATFYYRVHQDPNATT